MAMNVIVSLVWLITMVHVTTHSEWLLHELENQSSYWQLKQFHSRRALVLGNDTAVLKLFLRSGASLPHHGLFSLVQFSNTKGRYGTAGQLLHLSR